MTRHARVVYTLADSRHTVWTRHEDLFVDADAGCKLVNVETGREKILSSAVPHVVTKDVSLPPKVKENAKEAEIIEA